MNDKTVLGGTGGCVAMVAPPGSMVAVLFWSCKCAMRPVTMRPHCNVGAALEHGAPPMRDGGSARGGAPLMGESMVGSGSCVMMVVMVGGCTWWVKELVMVLVCGPPHDVSAWTTASNSACAWLHVSLGIGVGENGIASSTQRNEMIQERSAAPLDQTRIA